MALKLYQQDHTAAPACDRGSPGETGAGVKATASAFPSWGSCRAHGAGVRAAIVLCCPVPIGDAPGLAYHGRYLIAEGVTVEPVPPLILSGCITNANSYTRSRANPSKSRFSRR